MPDEKTNIAAQEAWGEAVNTGNLAAFDDLAAADSVDHDPAPNQVPGPQGYRDMFAELRTAFPDLHVEVVHLTVTDDDVAIAYTLTGTNSGPFLGHEPTGKAFRVRGVQIGRFADGKLVERLGKQRPTRHPDSARIGLPMSGIGSAPPLRP